MSPENGIGCFVFGRRSRLALFEQVVVADAAYLRGELSEPSDRGLYARLNLHEIDVLQLGGPAVVGHGIAYAEVVAGDGGGRVVVVGESVDGAEVVCIAPFVGVYS